ncbi:MAG: CinA family protein [Opitutaceae bacterium]|nr:CinA family protein [Opitutaceae bacterium]
MLKHLLLGPPPLTLAVAESMTGGRLQALVTAESGASAFFLGGITAYTLVQKTRHLGVDAVQAAAVDGVSAEVARAMARGVCALFGADFGLATTGYAEPLPARGQAEPGAFWALCQRLPDNRELWREGYAPVPGAGRVEAQEAVARAAYEALVEHLRHRGSAA